MLPRTHSPFSYLVPFLLCITVFSVASPAFAREMRVEDAIQSIKYKLYRDKATLQDAGCTVITIPKPLGRDTLVKNIPPNTVAVGALDAVYNDFVFCPPDLAERINKSDTEAWTDRVYGLEWYEKIAISLINNLVGLVAKLGVWILGFISELIGPLLGISKFVTNDLVATGWPFVQGVANLGFILALLFIAFTVTLRLNIGGGARRLIPRLLIAALLINFSLVIGALLIDASRILMAVMARIMGVNNLQQIGGEILAKSGQLKGVFTYSTASNSLSLVADNNSWNVVLDVVRATFFIWMLGAAFIILGIGLIIRYFALIILLIFSPLAYLAVAVPGADGLVKKWWSEFIKYVVYGPAVLFVLLLLIGITKGAELAPGVNDSAVQNMLHFALTVVLLIFAATVGKKLGTAGADATVSFTKGLYKKGGRGAVGAAALLARPVARRVRDFVKEETKPTRKQLRLGKYSIYDEKGQLKEGKSSRGSSAGELFSGERRRKQAETTDAANAVGAADFDNPALTGNRLKQGHVLLGLGPNAGARDARVDLILDQGRASQQRGVVQNKDYLREANKIPGRIAEIEHAILANITVTPSDRQKIVEELYKTLDEIAKE